MTIVTLSYALLVATATLVWVLLDRYFAMGIAGNLSHEHPHNLRISAQREFLAVMALVLLITLVSLGMLTVAFGSVVGTGL